VTAINGYFDGDTIGFIANGDEMAELATKVKHYDGLVEANIALSREGLIQLAHAALATAARMPANPAGTN
jgi:hypothetical protein